MQKYHTKLKASIGVTPVIPTRIPASAVHPAASDAVGPVGILGAGPGGLYAALILEDLGIPYRIIEAQDKVGGRLFTYKFPNNTGAPYNYFDVGAMRFPKISSMERVFHLFDYPPLNTGGIALKSKLQPFYYVAAGTNDTFYYYNGVRVRQNEMPAQDPFKAKEVIRDVHADPYIAAGTKAIIDDVINPFATRLLEDLKQNFDFDVSESPGWKYMQSFDLYSIRAYMSIKYSPSPSLNIPDKPLPTDVVNWCETFDKSSGWYDRALTETVLEDVAFGWQPGPDPPPTQWFCIDGGAHQIAECMAKYISSRKPDVITFNSKVTSIAFNGKSGIDVTTNHAHHHQFSHVISTIPLPVLRTLDLSKAELSPMQANALRELNYGPAVKVGLQFRTAWWTTGTDLEGKPLNIVGGQSYTDRPLRTIVYPSFGNVQAGETTTLIASYCWTEDATRMSALIDKDEKTLLNLVLKELAEIHNVKVDFLRHELIDHKAWSWSHDPYTMGGYAFFGPGKFESLYTSLNAPAAKGYLHFAGEAISARHAWVEGALDSALKAVHEIVHFPAFQSYKDKFFQNWGVNPEWMKPSTRRRGPGAIPRPEEDLILEHLALTHPYLF
jgi:monoamine oxidase